MESKLLEEKVQVRSIANWGTATPRLLGAGDIMIQPNGMTMISRDELINQSQRGNKLINGTDGKGSHATWIIEDGATREELMFEEYDTVEKIIPGGISEKTGKPLKDKIVTERTLVLKQNVVTDENVKETFAFGNYNEFEEKMRDLVYTRAEKITLMKIVDKLNCNDYRKIRLCEDISGIRK